MCDLPRRLRLVLLASFLLLMVAGMSRAQDVPLALDRLRQIEQLLPTLTLSLDERRSDLMEREKLSNETEAALTLREHNLVERETSLNGREYAINEREILTYERESEYDAMETALQTLSASFGKLSKRYSLAKYGLVGAGAVILAETILLLIR